MVKFYSPMTSVAAHTTRILLFVLPPPVTFLFLPLPSRLNIGCFVFAVMFYITLPVAVLTITFKAIFGRGFFVKVDQRLTYFTRATLLHIAPNVSKTYLCFRERRDDVLVPPPKNRTRFSGSSDQREDHLHHSGIGALNR